MNEDIQAWLQSGDRVAVATVVNVVGSAPRPPGAKMAMNQHGQLTGAVSGGCVEGAVAEAAADVLAGADPKLLHFGIPDAEAWDVGLPCGGEIDVFVEEYLRVTAQSQFARIAREEGRAALVTVVASTGRAPVGAKLLVPSDGERQGSLGDEQLNEVAANAAEEVIWAERAELHDENGVSLFVDVTAPAPRLVILGAADHSSALCRVARAAGWRPIVCDPRSRFATTERLPEAEQVLAAWPVEAFERLGGIDRATYVAVLTHDPKLDDAAMKVVLGSEARCVGVMGSRQAHEKRRERLIEAGVDEGHLDDVAAPVRLDLGAATPEETALSIMAEVIAVRSGRAGGRLPNKRSTPRRARVIGGIVLAAGVGARFTGRKQLAQLNGRPLLEHALRAMAAADVRRTVVVLGAGASEVLGGVRLHGAKPVFCERWQEGASASLACGLDELQDSGAVVVTLGDQPRISPDAIRRLLDARGEAPAVRATYGGRPGHPVVIERVLFDRLREATGDQGARDLLRAVGAHHVACDDLGGDEDVDTREELDALDAQGVS